MESAEFRFLIHEYLSLWKDLGIESLAPYTAEELLETMTHHSSQASATKPRTLNGVKKWLGQCQRCRLCEGRKNIVFGTGEPKAKLMFVGEGPGADEDVQGLPFVGRAGKLLTRIIEAMGYTREAVYIANVVKCRPPQNRTPLPDEVEQCFPFLKAQIECIHPQFVVALGLPATHTLLGISKNMSAVRGRFHPLCWNPKVQVMPTYHPAYLLRNPSAKRIVWEDMKLVKAKLEGNQ